MGAATGLNPDMGFEAAGLLVTGFMIEGLVACVLALTVGKGALLASGEAGSLHAEAGAWTGAEAGAGAEAKARGWALGSAEGWAVAEGEAFMTMLS